MKCLGLDTRELDLLKYNRDQPRVPAGSGRESGRWTSPGGGNADRPEKPIVLAGGPKNRLEPDPNAEGPHSSLRRDPKTGVIQHYETYEYNERAGIYSPILRYRGTGGTHGRVEPPLIIEPRPNKEFAPLRRARPALPSEIPGGGGGWNPVFPIPGLPRQRVPKV